MEEIYEGRFNEKQTICTNNVSIEDQTIFKILLLFALCEKLTEYQQFPWEIDERLQKRRKAYTFDGNLQNLILLLRNEPNLEAKVVSCGPSGLHKSEIILNDWYYLHFQMTSFDKNAKYNARYLLLNKDENNLRYAYFQYKLDNRTNRIISMKLVAPTLESKKVLYNFTNQLAKMRNFVQERYQNSVESLEVYEKIKRDIQQIKLGMLDIHNEEKIKNW